MTFTDSLEEEFWKATYLAAVACEGVTHVTAVEVADKAVEELRERRGPYR